MMRSEKFLTHASQIQQEPIQQEEHRDEVANDELFIRKNKSTMKRN